MNKKIFIILILIGLWSCNKEVPTQFSDEALNEIFIAVTGEEVTFQSILEAHKGKTIVIDIWATWCRDCIEEMPRIKSLQKETTDVDYVFLSLDRTIKSWKKGIETYNLKGDHYFMPSGWDGPFVDFIDLDWISRYMVIGPEGNIKLFKAIKVNNTNLRESLTN
jgi:thiol-disulfide isomerase/thioredoxin